MSKIFINSIEDAIEYLIEVSFINDCYGSDVLYSLNFIRMIDSNVFTKLEAVKSIGLEFSDRKVPKNKMDSIYKIYVDLQIEYGRSREC